MAIETPKKKAALNGQFKINPEVDAKLNAFMKANPDLVQYVKDLPREQLERKFIFRKMKDEEQRQGYDVKVKAWLEKPEQANLVEIYRASTHRNMTPEQQERAILTEAKNFIHKKGIKLG